MLRDRSGTGAPPASAGACTWRDPTRPPVRTRVSCAWWGAT